MLKSERGASAFLVASSLFLLFGMAAIGIDVGAGFNERRSNQTAADTAAVGGMLWSLIGTTDNTLQEGLDKAKEVAQSNTPNGLDEAAWASAWASCEDPSHLDRPSDSLGLTGGTECVSWNNSFTSMRVRLPTQSVDTSFGRVLGVASLSTFASAEASILSVGVGGSLPSGALGSAAGGTEICIKTGTGNNGFDSCGAPSTGDFQNFLPYYYEEIDPTKNPVSECDSGESGPGKPAMSRVIADGLDHYFSGAKGPGLGARLNGGWCKTAPKVPGPAFPDHVDSAGGYANDDITFGLIFGGDFDGPFSGRLDRGPYQSGSKGASDGFEIFDVTIDNLPLWSYMLSGTLHDDCLAVRSLPDHPSFTTTSYSVSSNSLGLVEVSSWQEAKALTAACLANETGALFDTEKLTKSPRLATVPRFWQTAPCGSNACKYDIKDFAPVFIQDMWANHKANSWTCAGEVEVDPGNYCRHMPGMTGEITVSAPGQKKISSASAFILRCSHFSDAICREVQNGIGGTTTIVADVRLTR